MCLPSSSATLVSPTIVIMGGRGESFPLFAMDMASKWSARKLTKMLAYWDIFLFLGHMEKSGVASFHKVQINHGDFNARISARRSILVSALDSTSHTPPPLTGGKGEEGREQKPTPKNTALFPSFSPPPCVLSGSVFPSPLFHAQAGNISSPSPFSPFVLLLPGSTV